jgi:hypothetical protein
LVLSLFVANVLAETITRTTSYPRDHPLGMVDYDHKGSSDFNKYYPTSSQLRLYPQDEYTTKLQTAVAWVGLAGRRESRDAPAHVLD